MKNQLILFCLGLIFLSCSEKSQLGMETELIEMGNMTEKISLMGDFVTDGHPTSGIASVNEAKTILSFKNFKTDNGPKLLVYLSTTVESTDFVNLGDLKGISGDYQYVIPANTDLTKHKYVVIWCVDFLVSFGHAELK